jgi:hypothetical protein
MSDKMYEASEVMSSLAYMISYEKDSLTSEEMRNISMILAELADTFLSQSIAKKVA